MIPVGGDGMAGLIGNLKALRHPRALLRVFAPRGPAQQPCAPAPASPLAPLMTAAPVPASPQATAHVPAPAAGEKPGAAPAAAGGTTKMENVR
jgi:hypothetical protein